MAEDKTYNGWSNYETWNVALWLGNDQGTYETCREMARECYANAKAEYGLSREENAKCLLAEALKNMIREGEPELGPSTYSDLLSAAISDVNWYEIASHYEEDFAEAAKAEAESAA